MLFIEQPAGVGFSYPNVPANDTTTAIDTVVALRNFLKRHDELQGRDFYIMGESYGGHYVPNTAKEIQVSNARLQLLKKKGHNSRGININDSYDSYEDEEPYINLKGFAVGNGYTDWKLDFNANVENGRFHALTSHSAMEEAREACNGDFARCFWPRDDVPCPDECDVAVQKATKYAMDGSIDIYDIYDDVCLQDGEERLETQITTLMKHRQHAIEKNLIPRRNCTTYGGTSNARGLRSTIGPVFPTCIDSFTQTYLNRKDVQRAIHVRPETIPNGKWSDCGNVAYTFNYESELDNYREWTSLGELRILIYNGDTDYILSHMGNSAWINEGLQLQKSQDWTMWRGSDGQVAGYFEQYETAGVPLTFLTIKGAGHMVPKDRPQHSLDMFEKFISGGKYDQVTKTATQPLCTFQSVEGA